MMHTTHKSRKSVTTSFPGDWNVMLIIPVLPVSGRVRFVPKIGKGRGHMNVRECCCL